MTSKKHLMLFVVLFSTSSCFLFFVQLYPKHPVLLDSVSEQYDLFSIYDKKEWALDNNSKSLLVNKLKSSSGIPAQVLPPVAYDYFVVPNVVHFIWFSRVQRHMQFTEMVSILSAYKNQQPDELYLHCNIEPVGQWWLELLAKVKFKTVIREIPTKIGDFNVTQIEHAADIAKIEILIQNGGGIILDYDVIVINSLDPLRKYNITMGKEKAPRLNAGIIIARNDSKFLHRWYRNYVEEYKSKSWDYNCCTFPYKLMLLHYDWIHVEDKKLTTPDWMDRHLLYTVTSNSELLVWRKFYVVHMMFHKKENRIYDPIYIKSLRNLIGKVFRLIYYGAENELSDFVPWVYYSKHPIVYNSTT